MSIGVPLTQEQIDYIRLNFSDMRNEDLARATGLSKSAVCNVQKRYHLRKSTEHNHKMGVRAGKVSSAVRGGVALNITPEVLKKRVESYKKTLRLERARVSFGLEQKTKIKVISQPKKKRNQRAYLKKLGYILDEKNNIAYWTEGTTRAVRMENGTFKNQKYYYKFMPYENKHQ